MKGNYVFGGSLMLAFVFCASTAAWGQKPDLSMRMGVYVTGEKTDSIDLKNDPYTDVGKTLQVKTKQATASGDNIYEFNVGILATREGGTLSNSLTTSIEGIVDGSGFTDRNEFTFPENQQVAQVIIKAILHLGLNHLYINIDPGNRYAESNENNNSMTVDLNLTGSPPIRVRKVDFSTTNILYLLHGHDYNQKGYTINTTKDLAINSGTTVDLYPKDAMVKSCHPAVGKVSQAGCTFHFGIVGTRANKTLVDGPYAGLVVYLDDKTLPVVALDLNMKAYATEKQNVFFMDLTAGKHHLKIVVDPQNTVPEENEGNNTFSVTVNVHA